MSINMKPVEIKIDKLIPFKNYSFDLFRGKLLDDVIEDMRDNISNDSYHLGICEPIFVRPLTNGKYEILDGHYRVAAAKKLKQASIPAILFEDLTDDDALDLVSDTNPIGLLLKCDIDIFSENYMESESFIKHRNERVIDDNSFSMALDEYIERFLLTNHDLYDLYKVIYEMGNPYELSERECEYEYIARTLVLVEDNVSDITTQVEKWENVDKSEESDTYIKKYYDRVNNIVNMFSRKKSGYTEQLKKYLNIDLDSFDYTNIQNKQERAKILYFFYKLKNIVYPDNKILELLSRPSMENIDNSFLGWETSNGKFIKEIKHSIEKEISLNLKNIIKKKVSIIVNFWGSFLIYERNRMEDLAQSNCVSDSLRDLFSESFVYESTDSFPTPLEILYLRLTQYEYLGQMKDLLAVNRHLSTMEYSVPPEYIKEMIKLETKKISIDDIDSFFESVNIKNIAHLVYLKPSISSDERRKIQDVKQMVLNFFNLPYLNFLQPDTRDNITELHIISCIQALILDKEKNDFDYTYYGYEWNKKEGKEKRKNKKSPRMALLKEDNPYDAYQVYWVYKMINHSYINVGKEDFIKSYRKLEALCIETLEKMLKCSTSEEMWRMHLSYYNNLIRRLEKSNFYDM